MDILPELEELVREAERRFGVRNDAFRLVPPQFHAFGPQLFYPAADEILIKLSFHCSHDPVRTTYQLAHESIHVLSPVPIGYASVLEEGLACYFASLMVDLKHDHQGDDDYSDAGDEWYNRAKALAESMLASNPDGIREIRKEHFIIADIPAEVLRDYYPSLTDEETDLLTLRFQQWRYDEQQRQKALSDEAERDEIEYESSSISGAADFSNDCRVETDNVETDNDETDNDQPTSA